MSNGRGQGEAVLDSGGLEILGREECLALLGAVPIGRIVFTDRALPAVQPVNFVLSGGDIVIRTGAGSKLAAASRGAVVAFEADAFDPVTRTGWSVVVTGPARVVSQAGELRRLRDLALPVWAPGERGDYLAITPELVSGRRIPAPAAPVA
ncbi:pyridoxamine 5'-phosphate oxidase family protein [Actinoallomurus spadix]|uniref:pyridoxamine 5'-phosphate oxidase family protein n=1 Tax=Actinoallomurus spadix TaxID=79912 RepID=UPI0020934D5D|nr:pyridoxamine 5'-phosphate oxidase family protein [Actinoallomurus spadix]MCO5991676.1 pyridoxamine 5'-phosphate oxidase family protein [Actinoallomurus spadix]